MADRFLLIHGDSKKSYGEVVFNGRFVFTLNGNIEVSDWNKIGFIELPQGTRTIESSDLFEHFNSRLPITLRKASNQEKIGYIKKNRLRVASDSFYLEEIKNSQGNFFDNVQDSQLFTLA